MRTIIRSILFCGLAGAMAGTAASAAGPRFYGDDPIAREPESRSAAGAKSLDISLFYEYAYNLFVESRRHQSNTRAGNINTADEVPDSSWFVNRIDTETITPQRLARGPNVGPPPAPEKWTLLREKSAGTNPGFTARDAHGETWFLQFDAPEFPEGSTGAVEVATKLFWALGYNQVETFLTRFDPARVEIDPKATIKRPSGERTPFTRATPTARTARRPGAYCRAPCSDHFVTRARARTIQTISCRTSIGASCAPCACSARGRTSWT